MIKHNLLVIFRNFKRNKSTFFINLIGLSTGLACALLIFLWVKDEKNIDKFNNNDSRLYQVMNNIDTTQGILTKNITPFPLAEALATEMEEVEHAVATNAFLFYDKEGILSDGDRSLKARGMMAGRDFFNVFSYHIAQGDKKEALRNKSSIVISESLAQKLFHTNKNIMGKTLEWSHPFFQGIFEISGVFEDPPPNATTRFDAIFSIDLLPDYDRWARQWGNCYVETCLILKKGTDIDRFNKKIAGFLKSKPSADNFTLFAQKYSRKYLYGKYVNGKPVASRMIYIRLFSIVALFILLIACINFVNLSTAKASTRMKEIGIRKTLGANKKTLMVQYLAESVIMAFLSLVPAFIIIKMLLPHFNSITGKHLTLHANPELLLPVLGITLATGIISGIYPAFYLSGFHPVAVIKGRVKTYKGELPLRKGLVIVQFFLAVFFITCFITINKQIQFIHGKNLGYDRDNILCFSWKGEYNFEDTVNNRLDAFMSELKKIPGVLNASSMTGSILKDIPLQSGISWRGRDSDRKNVFQAPIVGYDFIEMLGLKVIEGRSFSRDFGDEYSKVVVNETAVKTMGLDKPLGKILRNDMQIVGVVKDFHYGSLHTQVEPLILRFREYNQNIIVRIKAGTETTAIKGVEKIFKEFHPKYPFEFTFMDDEYQALYVSEMRVAALSRYFAWIAIIISCLGLFGLAAFSAERRRKEIGIRKVLGSSELGIVLLLTNDFTKMVLAAIGIALPVSYLIIKKWLSGFAYRVDLGLWNFAGAGLITLIIAWIVVSVQTFKAARTNPVKILKYE